MKRSTPLYRLMLLAFALVTPTTLWAAAAKVVIVAGDVFAIDAQEQRRELQRRSDVFEGDTLITGDNSQLQLRFEDNAILALRANSELLISEYHGASDNQNERVLMDLISGGFRTISGSFGKSDRDAYQVRTPNASIGIRGTHYEAVFQQATLTVGVYEGGVSVRNNQGELELGLDSNFLFAEVEANNTPKGLLNPPEILNVPSTRLRQPSDDEDETDGEEEATEDSENEDSDIDEEAIEQPPGETTSTTTDNVDTDTTSIPINALEDTLNENADQLEGDPRLTSAEEQALSNSSQVGFLVLAPGSLADINNTENGGIDLSVMFNYSATAPGGSTFYGNYANVTDDEDDFRPLTDVDPSQETAIAFVKTDGLSKTDVVKHELANGQTVEWGLWNASASNPALTYSDDESGAPTGTIDKPFYYVLAEPTTANLEGVSFYSGECQSTCFSSNLPEGTRFEGSLNVGLSGQSPGGYLNAYGELNFTEPNNNAWNIDYNGVVYGAQMLGVIGSGSAFTLSDDQASSYGLTGGVYGIFSGPDGELVFVGGVNASIVGDISADDLQNITTEDLNGVYILHQGKPIN